MKATYQPCIYDCQINILAHSLNSKNFDVKNFNKVKDKINFSNLYL